MSTATSTQLDATATALAQGAAKLAEHLRQQAALRTALEVSAADAEAYGLTDFAGLFHDMAKRLSPPADPAHDAKSVATTTKRRGRPAKPVDEQAMET